MYVNGFRVEAHALHRRKPTPSETAYHEAEHSVVAEKNGTFVKRATIVPGPGYGGLTEMTRPDPIAAAAPHAQGRSGTSYDVFIIGLMGVSVGSAASAAQSILRGNQEHVEAVASELEDKRTLSGEEIRQVMTDVEKGKEVVVFIRSPKGEEQRISERSRHKAPVEIPKELVTLPKAA